MSTSQITAAEWDQHLGAKVEHPRTGQIGTLVRDTSIADFTMYTIVYRKLATQVTGLDFLILHTEA